MYPSTLRKYFKLDVIHFTGYGVIAEKSRIGSFTQKFSVHPVEKNYALDQKMIATF